MKRLTRSHLEHYLEENIRAPFRLHSDNQIIEGTLISLKIEKEEGRVVTALQLIAENVVTVDKVDRKPIGIQPEANLPYIDSPLLVAYETEASITIRSHRELLTIFLPTIGIPPQDSHT